MWWVLEARNGQDPPYSTFKEKSESQCETQKSSPAKIKEYKLKRAMRSLFTQHYFQRTNAGYHDK